MGYTYNTVVSRAHRRCLDRAKGNRPRVVSESPAPDFRPAETVAAVEKCTAVLDAYYRGPNRSPVVARIVVGPILRKLRAHIRAGRRSSADSAGAYFNALDEYVTEALQLVMSGGPPGRRSRALRALRAIVAALVALGRRTVSTYRPAIRPDSDHGPPPGRLVAARPAAPHGPPAVTHDSWMTPALAA